ncbi:MAG: hypothetical protein L0Y36_06625 [Planctomycetales bacterium]|nr:hypothetical protein [Planctomycetales bacterium]
MENPSVINPSEATVTSQAEPTRRQGVGSIVWGVASIVLLALQTPVTEFAGLKVLEFFSTDPNYIAAAWVLLLSSMITGAIAIGVGLRQRRTRMGRIGFLLGVISLVGIVIWEFCGGWFCLFWAP